MCVECDRLHQDVFSVLNRISSLSLSVCVFCLCVPIWMSLCVCVRVRTCVYVCVLQVSYNINVDGALALQSVHCGLGYVRCCASTVSASTWHMWADSHKHHGSKERKTKRSKH